MPIPETGSKAPALRLPDQNGSIVDLAALAGRDVVVYFYPKDATPGCTVEACDFRDSFARLTARGVAVFGISRDSEASHRRFREKQGLPFDLLSDVEGKACEAWGVWQLKKFMGREAMGIVRSTFLIGADGRIRRAWSPVSVKGHVEEVIAAL